MESKEVKVIKAEIDEELAIQHTDSESSGINDFIRVKAKSNGEFFVLYGNRWLRLKDGNITQVSVYVHSKKGVSKTVKTEPIKLI